MPKAKDVVLSVKNIYKSFGKRAIIKDISFDVLEGEIFGFLGPNGSGKTTTIKMILGLLSIDKGSVTIAGFDRQKEFESALSNIGGIIENPDTYGYLSATKNLEIFSRMHGKVDRARIAEVLRMVGLEGRAKNKVKTYSLGMKQRLGLAQAVLHRPKVMILDEPTNGLDPAGIHELRDILKQLAHVEGISVFVSSHILSEMELLCDRVCIISEGRVLETRSVVELLDTVNKETSKYRFILRSKGNVEKQLKELLADQYISGEGDSYLLMAQEDDIPKIISSLMGVGILVYGIIPEKQSLEDSFLEITGGGNTIA